MGVGDRVRIAPKYTTVALYMAIEVLDASTPLRSAQHDPVKQRPACHAERSEASQTTSTVVYLGIAHMLWASRLQVVL